MSTDRDWMRHAACHGSGELFFHPDGERGRTGSSRAAAAKRICRGCTVRAECDGYADATDTRYGVWGGKCRVQQRERERERASRPAGVEVSRG